MTKNEKIFVSTLILITIIVSIFAIFRKNDVNEVDINKNQTGNNTTVENKNEFVKELDNGVSFNISEKFKETKEFEGLKIKDLQLTKNNNITKILGTVVNISEKTIPFQLLKLKLVDKTGKEIITVSCAIKELAVGESTQLNTSATFDYVNAYDFIILK